VATGRAGDRDRPVDLPFGSEARPGRRDRRREERSRVTDADVDLDPVAVAGVEPPDGGVPLELLLERCGGGDPAQSSTRDCSPRTSVALIVRTSVSSVASPIE